MPHLGRQGRGTVGWSGGGTCVCLGIASSISSSSSPSPSPSPSLSPPLPSPHLSSLLLNNRMETGSTVWKKTGFTKERGEWTDGGEMEWKDGGDR